MNKKKYMLEIKNVRDSFLSKHKTRNDELLATRCDVHVEENKNKTCLKCSNNPNSPSNIT